jgi:hypothetical protein
MSDLKNRTPLHPAQIITNHHYLRPQNNLSIWQFINHINQPPSTIYQFGNLTLIILNPTPLHPAQIITNHHYLRPQNNLSICQFINLPIYHFINLSIYQIIN